jgi:tRNA-uridine 2-sulfurtransferase
VDSVKLRYRSEPLRCRVTAPAGDHAALDVALAEDALGVAPGQTACLMDGDLVVGHGTIAASA